MKSYNNIFSEILNWHKEDRQSTIKRTFALGDLIVKAVIHTGMTEYEIIKRIMADLGELAYGQTTYNRAARMSRVFTRNQRQVLIDKFISIDKAELLCAYPSRKRTQMIANIKSGKTKSTDIKSTRAKLVPDADLTGPEYHDKNSQPKEYLCSIVLRGDEDEERCECAVLSLFSALKRMGQPVKKMAEQALSRVVKI